MPKLRDTSRIDYDIYHKKGLKVLKDSGKIDVKMANLVDEELKIVKKFSRFFNEYEVSILYEVQDIEIGIKELKVLADSYEDVHVQLNREIGDNVYKETYTDYEDQILKVTKWIRDAKLAINEKKARKSADNDQEKLCESEKEIDKIKAEEKYFRKRIGSELEAMHGENSDFLEDLEKNLSAAEALKKEYYSIFVKIESMGTACKDEYENVFDKQVLAIDSFIEKTKKCIHDVKLVNIEDEKKRKCSEEIKKRNRK